MTRRQLRAFGPIAAWLSLGAVSCGRGTDGAVSAAIPTDGLGSFGSFEPIELCRGTARVVAPSQATGAGAAVCIAEGRTAKSCSGDPSCSGIEHCTCGRCIVRACQGAASCGEGEICRGKRCTRPCTSDDACAQGERCVSGGCARTCSSDAACHFGEQCDALDGACVSRLCSASVKCGTGDACDVEEVLGEAHEPEIVSLESGPVAFLEIREGAGAAARRAIYRVRIDAPDRWTADPPTPVLADDDAGGLGAPSALLGADELVLFFEVGDGASIGRGRSKDGGKTFVRDAAPVLVPAVPWEAGRVASPSVFAFRGDTYVAYEIGARAGVGLARVTDGGADRLGSGPIATPATFEDPVFWRGLTEVGAPYALVAPSDPSAGFGGGVPTDDGVVRIYVTARGAEGSDAMTKDGPIPADRNDSIGLLTSIDLSSFERFPTGPVFARVVNLRAYLGEREPMVRLRATGAELTFVAADASGQSVTGLAHAGGAGP